MAKFKCKKCKCEKKILKQTLVFEKEKLIVKEAKCKCGKYFGRKKMGIQCKRCKTLVKVRYRK